MTLTEDDVARAWAYGQLASPTGRAAFGSDEAKAKEAVDNQLREIKDSVIGGAALAEMTRCINATIAAKENQR